MRWQDTSEQVCSLARSMSIFGDRWTLLVIRQVFMKIQKFSSIQKSLGITKHRLSDRLNRLVNLGILYKKPYDNAGTKFEYKLTEKGLALFPIIIGIVQWGDDWLTDQDGPPIVYQHKTCGHFMRPKLCCTECQEEISVHNTFGRPGPGITKKIARNDLSDSNVRLYAESMPKV